MPGMVYEGDPKDEWDEARHCSLHDAYEMFHTCAGGPGEPLGYCKAWDGELVGTTETNGRIFGGWPTCQFDDE